MFVQDGPPGAFQPAGAGIRIHAHNQDVALLFCAGKIAHMANVQRVKATVGKHDALAMALGTGEEKLEVFARLGFSIRLYACLSCSTDCLAVLPCSANLRSTKPLIQ